MFERLGWQTSRAQTPAAIQAETWALDRLRCDSGRAARGVGAMAVAGVLTTVRLSNQQSGLHQVALQPRRVAREREPEPRR